MLAPLIALAMRIRFDPASARDLDAVFALRVRVLGGRTLPLRLEVRSGAASIRRGPAPEAAAAVTIGLADMIRMGVGLIGWPRLLSSGRLELSGDPFLALRFPSLFRLSAVGSGIHGAA
jgi:hypothetical protein